MERHSAHENLVRVLVAALSERDAFSIPEFVDRHRVNVQVGYRCIYALEVGGLLRSERRPRRDTKYGAVRMFRRAFRLVEVPA